MTSVDTGSPGPRYRPDIDGLRAVAVLAVVAFHASPMWLRGGFIGVDVFFVISGFLISSIIFEGLEKGTFGFAAFYARRIRRLFPALLLVFAACLVFGWYVLLADEYRQLGRHTAAGAGFMSNFVLWREAGYFDNASDTKPLLHLWSLGIEEQFYVVWPLLVWIAWRLKFNLLLVIGLIAALSFALNMVTVRQDAVSAFYAPQTRFWELLCGGALAWVALYGRDCWRRLTGARRQGWTGRAAMVWQGVVAHPAAANVLSLAGVALLGYGFLRIHGELDFPGRWAVIPVLGAVLLIAAGPGAFFNRTVLSNRVAVWFGLISFPLYLWHWPLLSFARIIESEVPSRGIRFAAVVLAIALAWLTYALVERRIRRGSHGGIKVAALVVLMAAVGFAGYGIHLREGIPAREVVQLNAVALTGDDGGDGGNLVRGCGIADEATEKLFRGCATDRRGNVRYALLGDSKADALHSGLVRTSEEHGRWMFIGGNGPHGAPVPLLSDDAKSTRPLTVAAVDAIARATNIETVAIVTAIRAVFRLSDGVRNGNLATYDYNYLETLPATSRYDAAFDGLSRTIARLVAADKKIVLLVDNPALPNPKDCVVRRTALAVVDRLLDGANSNCFVPLSRFMEQTAVYRRLLQALKDRYRHHVEIVDPTDIYCDMAAGFCGPTRNGRRLYIYTDHISDYAAGLVGARLNAFLRPR